MSMGLGCDMVLNFLGRDFFAWEGGRVGVTSKIKREILAPKENVFTFCLTPEEKALKEKYHGRP